MAIDYDEDRDGGQYYDQEMADIIADAAEKEFLETCRNVQQEYEAEQESLVI